MSNQASIQQQVTSYIEQHRDDYVGFLKEMVSKDSRMFDMGVTGNEANAQKVVEAFLAEYGARVDTFEPDYEEMSFCPEVNPGKDYTGRYNVVGTFSGTGGGKSLLFNGHIDTVDFVDPALWTTPPLEPSIREGKLYGRGACDMKGGLSASLMAMKALADLGIRLKGDVIYESVVDEEGGGNGTLACVARGYKADAGIIPEPSDLWIAPAHMGWLIYRIETEGIAIHSGAKIHGVNAIEKMVKIITALQDAERHWALARRHPYLPTQNIGIDIIHGGTGASIVPNHCEIEVTVNILPNNEPGYSWPGEKFDLEVRDLIRRVAASDEWMEKHPPKVTLFQLGSACDVGIDHPICNTLSEQTGFVLGAPPKHKGLVSGADGRLLNNYGGTPTVHFGPGSMETAHTVDEFVPVDEYVECIKIFALTMMDWCGVE